MTWIDRNIMARTIVAADNITERYVTMGNRKNAYQTKQNRLLNFNTDTDGEISIEMQFAVPFIKIPVDKAIDATKGAVAKVNIAAVVVSAAIALMTGFILPALVKVFSLKFNPMMEMMEEAGRGGKSESSDLWHVLTLMDQALTENNLDTTSCMQRFVCWATQNTVNKISNGKATSADKIIDGIITSDWINNMVDGTPIHSALKNGLKGISCSREYNTCKLSQKTFLTLLKQFSNTINLT
ncbi:hypothetical protein RN001_000750 [Aquatica leii]|uniref:Uncharacterized protein n=1 Tax=Aquatica leii TaxID=1421715 RepID=A0AAN7Q3B0_9COLE|nr:hypothetical protein RN001_000750 [Aquatica leii]